MSDVPCLKGRDKLVWKSVVWGDIQLTISGCVFRFLLWACSSPTLEKTFSPGQGLGAGCSNTAPAPTRGWAWKPHWLNLLHGGGSGKWKIPQEWTKRLICNHGGTQRGQHHPAGLSQEEGHTEELLWRGSWLCSHWDPAWLQGERPPAALQTSYKIWN